MAVVIVLAVFLVAGWAFRVLIFLTFKVVEIGIFILLVVFVASLLGHSFGKR